MTTESTNNRYCIDACNYTLDKKLCNMMRETLPGTNDYKTVERPFHQKTISVLLCGLTNCAAIYDPFCQLIIWLMKLAAYPVCIMDSTKNEGLGSRKRWSIKKSAIKHPESYGHSIRQNCFQGTSSGTHRTTSLGKRHTCLNCHECIR